MPTEILVLAAGCVLAFVYVMCPALVKTRQYGTRWNLSARDEPVPPPSPLARRLERAQANFFETFPTAVALMLALVVMHRDGGTGAVGAVLWLAARVVYLPLYAAGVPVVRTLVFGASVVGLALMLVRLLSG